MACFIVPTAEAIIVTAATQLVKSKEKTPAKVTLNCTNGGIETAERLPFSRKLKWLSNLLWGGSALLAFEHVWHGEITAWFPFLTAAGNTKDAAAMLGEMGSVGVTMAALVTLMWAVMVGVTSALEKKALNETPALEEN